MKKNSGIFIFFLTILISFGLIFKPAYSANDAGLLPPAVQQFFDSNGNPLSSGKVYFYEVGTETFKDIYNSSAATTPYTNPITLNAGGKPPGGKGIYGIGLYRQQVKDKNGNIIWDAVTSPSGSGGGGSSSVGDGNSVGTILPWSGLIAPNQYIFAYGQELVRSTYPEFFTAITLQTNVICTSFSNTLTGIADTSQIPIGSPIELDLCVSPGTTVISKTSGSVTLSSPSNVSLNATARFFPYGNGNGSTTFNVPDLRDIVLAGRPNMGGTDRGLITSQYFGSDPNGLGALGGTQSITLSQSNLPNVTLNTTIAAGQGSHTHTSGNGGSFMSTTSSATSLATSGAQTFSTTSTTSPSTLPAMNGTTPLSGNNIPVSIIQPTLTINYIIKIAPDTPISTQTVVTQLGGMTGVISCGSGLTCNNQTVSVNPATGTDISIKLPVRVASTGNLTLFGLVSVDGITVAVNDRVLVKDQTNAIENGIYTASASNWVRAVDFDENTEVVQGTQVYVNSGTQNQLSTFEVTSSNPIIIGSAINFSGDRTIAGMNTITGGVNIISSNNVVMPTLNSGVYLELTNTSTGQYRGGEIRFSRETGSPYAVIKSEEVTGPSPYKGDLVIYTRDFETEVLTQRLRINMSGGTYSGDGIVAGVSPTSRYNFGATNSFGSQGFISYTKSSLLDGIYTPGEYVASTAGGYFVGENDYVGVANTAAYGVYAEGRASNNAHTVGIEADVQNTTGIAPRVPNPNNVFGSGSAPSSFALWLANVGTKAPLGQHDNSAAIGLPSPTVDYPARFIKGIVFGADTLRGDGGHFEALALPASYELSWYNSDGTNINRLTGNGTTFTLTGQNMLLLAANASDVALTVGTGATGNRNSRIYFGASSTGGNADAEILRASGANGNLQIINAGIGALTFSTNSTLRGFFDGSTGDLTVSSTDDTTSVSTGAINSPGGIGFAKGLIGGTFGRFGTYLGIGSTSAPANTTAGDFTATRGFFGGTVTVGGQFSVAGAMGIMTGVAIPAGGGASLGYRFTSTADFGVFPGSGVPTVSTAKGSLYLRSDGTTNNTRLYVNNNGTTAYSGILTDDGAVSATKTVRASGGLADCTLIFTSGVLTGGTC